MSTIGRTIRRFLRRHRRHALPWVVAGTLILFHQLVPEGTSRLSIADATPQEPSLSRVHPTTTLVPKPSGDRIAWAQGSRDPFALLRHKMVEEQIRKRGVEEKNVLEAMEEVPRHRFVATDERDEAYKDCPVSIGWGQNMYQPYIVALMTELLGLDGDERVLEIGTGSGYHSAVLSRVAKQVYSIEINDKLARAARRTLSTLGYDNVEVRTGDGYLGWPEEAPFDAIILTAAPPEVPKTLIDQLKVGGRMVVPVGGFLQDLQVLTKTADGKVSRRTVAPVRVTAMTGEAQKQR